MTASEVFITHRCDLKFFEIVDIPNCTIRICTGVAEVKYCSSHVQRNQIAGPAVAEFSLNEK